MPQDFDSLKIVGQGLKELSKKEDSGFKELSALKDILKPLKELIDGASFQELSSLKIGFEPLKPTPPHGPGKKGEGKKDESNSSNNAKGENTQISANVEETKAEDKETKKYPKKDDKKDIKKSEKKEV